MGAYEKDCSFPIHNERLDKIYSWFGLVVWTPSRGRKVGVPRGILPQVQGGVEPPSTRQLELKPAWDKGGILRPVQS